MNGKEGKDAIDRAFMRAIKKKSRKRTLLWILLCFTASIAVSLLVHFIPVWYEKFANYHDPFYRPLDIERQYQTLERQRGRSPNN
ncbi:MAG: hypothetical protein K0B01_12255 [Syntrophobacterales bacterium]|nr:hypothetical protein [Syntrophobacterales bacterium]